MPLPANKPIEDLVGQNFGRLTVQHLMRSSNQYGTTHWSCQCDCGRTVVLTDYRLRTLTGGCGDRHCQHRRYRPQPEKPPAPEQGGTNTMQRVRLAKHGNGATPTTLEQRITRALAPDHDIAAATIAALYQEIESAIAIATTTAEDSKHKALDPTITDIEAARVERDDAIYRLERLRAALPALQERYTQVRKAERAAQWQTAYAKVKVKRDAAASNLKDIYQELTEQLLEVLEQAKAVDQQVETINSTAPNGQHDRLLTVECAARGVNSVGPNSVLSLLTDLKLPHFAAPGLAWPPPTPVMTAEMVVPAAMLTHPGANWHEALKERDAARQQEAKRVADYHARREREKEDMENARARAEQERRRQAAST